MDTTAVKKQKVIKSDIEIRPHAWIVRGFLRFIAILFNTIFTDTIIEGRENIPQQGPAIFAANHASIYDAILYYVILPFHTQYVGPGDFRLAYPNRIASEWTDVILVKRGSSDKNSLRRMLETLKSGRPLALFPEGGTWEKNLYDVKDGAAYLSMSTGAPIVPISISGAYNPWQAIFALKRPRIVIRIMPPMPPVPKARGAERKRVLQQASYDLMYNIYQGLTQDELNRYITWMRERFDGSFEVKDERYADLFEEAHNYQLLGRLISKTNLFSTFHQHLELPMKPFQQLRRYHSAQEFREAVQSLYQALTVQLPGYIGYRLGDDANEVLLAELTEIDSILSNIEPDTQLRFKVDQYLADESELTISVENPPSIEAA